MENSTVQAKQEPIRGGQQSCTGTKGAICQDKNGDDIANQTRTLDKATTYGLPDLSKRK